jgi:FtsP/CotA-like multicopper oxidase with cupredoxin domain
LAACVSLAALLVPAVAPAATQEYWVTATRRPWVIVPNGHDALAHDHTPLDPARLKTEAIVYERWSRDFGDRLPNGAAGLVGPLLRARVGDRLAIHFRNLDLDAPHSMHFHGVEYKPSSDGAFLPGFSGRDAVVQPGDTYTYRLTAGRQSAGVWPYHDHSTAMGESIAAGMYGVLSILGRHERAPDRENVVFFAPMGDFMSIDGRAFVGNTPVFHSRVGDLVQWDVLTLGDDSHTFHVHGHRWLEHGVPRDTRTIGPAESFRVRWRERDPGTWLYHCHVESHMMNGMIGIYRVKSR